MYDTAHELIAQKINRQLKHPFPPNALLHGAIDPDKKSGYTGDEYKHHYDDVSIGAGRHDRQTILNVVWRHVRRARDSWLKEDKEGSAFEFGIASHYLTDGLIISPSADKEKHTYGDSAFSTEVRKLRPFSVEFPDRTGERFVQGHLKEISKYFGQNNPKTIIDAYRCLLTIGLAVSEDPVPEGVSTEIEDLSKRCREKLASLLHLYEQSIERFKESLPFIVWKRAQNILENSAFCRKGLGLKELFARLERANFSPLAHLGEWLFRRRLRKVIHKKPAIWRRNSRRKTKQILASYYSILLRLRRSLSSDRWYSVEHSFAEWTQAARQAEWEQESSYAEIEQEFRRKEREEIKKCLTTTRRTALRQLPDWWIGSQPDRIGYWCANNKGARCLPILLPVMLAYLVCLRYLFAGGYVVAILSGLGALLWLAFSCLELRQMQIVSTFVRQKVRFRCPICNGKVKIWIGFTSHRVTCPRCNRKFKVGAIKSRDTYTPTT